MMFVWIGSHPLIGKNMLIGCVNIKLTDMMETTQMDSQVSNLSLSQSTEQSYRTLKIDEPVCHANMKIGSARIQLCYKIK